jgi:23S rRNA pseudouridine1911/1915/1917 synthase
MEQNNAFKVLAEQLNISNKKAKTLIDRGLVYVGQNKVKIARALINEDTKFRVENVADIKILYEDEDIIAVDKPAFLDSYDVQDSIPNSELLHRLDRDTSGVLLLGKNEKFIKKAVEEFRNRRVKKIYTAWVEGTFFEETIIDAPIHTIKRGKAISKIDERIGKKAITKVTPLEIQGKKSKVVIEIGTGRTHQIRVHMSHIGHPVVGDELYGSRTKSSRILLHSKQISIFKYSFEAREPKEILKYK